MKPLRIGFCLAAVMAFGGSYYALLVPKIGHASRGEIEAVLPARLWPPPYPDQQARARYLRLLGLIETLDRRSLQSSSEANAASTPKNERILRKVEALISEGPILKPERGPESKFSDLSSTKDAAKLMGSAAEAAWRRRDRRACAHWVTTGLRYSDALTKSGGVGIDALVAIAIHAIAVRTAYRAEIENGLDATGRTEILALLPEGDGSSPAFAQALRNEFDQFLLPVIFDPRNHHDSLISEFLPFPGLDGEKTLEKPPMFGTFDPVETAREASRVVEARIADLERPFLKETHDEERLIQRIAHGLPEPPGSFDDASYRLEGWPGLRFRMAMNAGHNTLGRRVAANAVFTQTGAAAVRSDASRNLARAVILLRTGRSSRVLDPYSGKPLRIDRRRKVVWSVGQNGKDDGGRIGLGGDSMQPDLGYPYGDRSFHPNPNGPFRAEPPGMLPPP